MPMRVDCKHYESRTYANGDVVRKCRIDLAPEAPWRCPEGCVGFERRLISAGWQVGSIDKGYDVVGSSPEEFAAYLKTDSASRARAVKISGAKAE